MTQNYNENDYPHSDITHRIIGAAIEVHKALGPGLLESSYEICLADELERCDVKFQRQVSIPVIYKNRHLDCGYRMDFDVENSVIVELKCVEKLMPIHSAQLLTYLRLANRTTGLLINFNVEILRQGIVRKVLSNNNSSSASSEPQR